MKEILKKSFYFGVGALTATAEKVEELVDELIRRGEANKAEKSKLIEELMAKIGEQEKEFTARIKSVVQNSWQEYGFPGKKEFEDLKARVERLEKAAAKPKAAPKKAATRKKTTEK